jgi:hypothetical protein
MTLCLNSGEVNADAAGERTLGEVPSFFGRERLIGFL